MRARVSTCVDVLSLAVCAMLGRSARVSAPGFGCRRQVPTSDALSWRCGGLFATTGQGKTMPACLPRSMQVILCLNRSPRSVNRCDTHLSVLADVKRLSRDQNDTLHSRGCSDHESSCLCQVLAVLGTCF